MGLPDDLDSILESLRERRAIVFAGGEIGRAASVLGEEGWEGYTLLGTGGSIAQADPALGSEAGMNLIVPVGPVPKAAAAILDHRTARGEGAPGRDIERTRGLAVERLPRA